MLVIVYSETDSASVEKSLGKSEYSYYFILKKYLPRLELLGDIIYVKNPGEEVDELYEEALARQESAVFLSFSPPHRTEIGLKCPTVCILAWEFSSVPDEQWSGNPRDNWVESIRQIGNIITISAYSTEVINSQVGVGLNIATIPAPVTDAPPPKRLARGVYKYSCPPLYERVTCLSVEADVIDTDDLDISDDIVCFRKSREVGVDLPVWDQKPLEFIFDDRTPLNNGYRFLVGFHNPEEWGTWSRSDRPWISLPVALEGDFTLEIDLVVFKNNSGRDITVTIGDQSQAIRVDTALQTYTLDFQGVIAGTVIEFSNLEIGYTVEASLLRALSVGVARMRLIPPVKKAESVKQELRDSIAPALSGERQKKTVELNFSGPVYTAIFNPEDGRKNWEDIVTAFVWAFRDQPDKTLILKYSCSDMASNWGRLFLLYSQLNPFSCRIVVIHGYLSSTEMASLASATDFFVNASKAEGQCLPLLEFMAQGVPAIAPDHTAMSSYINKDNAFIVESARVATCWPQDPREHSRTFFYRIDWESLKNCFQRSADLLATDVKSYSRMSFNAASVVRREYSLDLAGDRLGDYLEHFRVSDAE